MGKSYYIIPIFVVHEGCPHKCVFCNQNTITGSVNKVDSDYVDITVKEYLDTLPKNGATIEISFFGGTFTAIPYERQIELLSCAKKYKDRGLIKSIRLSTRPDYINDSILSYLKEYGVDIIELGVQSMDDEVLFKSGRGHTAGDVEKAALLIKKYGFILGFQVMPGLPGDTREKDIKTVKSLISLKPDLFRIYPALVIKNTPMEKMYNDGIYIPYSLHEALLISKVLYGMLTANGINVIRIGLQPTSEINTGKEVIAGPFHPAFGELVDGLIIHDLILDMPHIKDANSVTITVSKYDISKLYCMRKKFFDDIKNHINPGKVNVISDDYIERGTFLIAIDRECYTMSIMKYMKHKYKEGNFNLI